MTTTRSDGRRIASTLRATYDWRALGATPEGLVPVLTVAALAFFAGLSTRVLELATLDIARDLGFTLEGIVKFTSAAGTATLLVALAVGHFGDRHHRVRMLAAGLVLAGVAGSAAGAAGSPLTLGAAVVASDVFFFVAAIPTVSLLADWYPHVARGRAFALVGLGQALGAALAYSVGGEIIDGLGWRVAYPLLFAPVVALGVFALVGLREPRRGRFDGSADDVDLEPDDRPSFAEAWRAIWGIRVVRRLFVADSFATAGIIVFGASLVLNLVERHGYTPSDLGSVFAGAALFAVVGAVFGGALVDRFADRRPAELLMVFGAFTAVSALATTGPLASSHRVALILALGVHLFGGALLGPTLGVLYASVVPAHIRTLGGSVRALTRLPAVLVALPLLNVAIESAGLHRSLWMGFPMLVVAAILFASAAPLYELDRRSATARDRAILHWHGAQAGAGGATLVCRGLGVEHRGGAPLTAVDLDVRAGEVLAVVGGNGSGKTTLLRAIAGLSPATSGAVLLDGRDATFTPPHEMARWGVQLVPAGGGVFDGLTVAEHLDLAAARSGSGDGASSVPTVRHFPALEARLDTAALHLSTGERRMLSLELALSALPRVLLVDELSAGLAPLVVRNLLATVRSVADAGVAVVLAEASTGVALEVADRVVVLEHGESTFSGPPDVAARHPALRAHPSRAGAQAPRSGTVPAGAAGAAIEVDEVVKQFGGVVALDRVSIEVRAGSVTALVGPNGSGKTTLLDVMSGLAEPEAGRVRLLGDDVTGLATHERARRGLMRRFEEPRLVPSLTVREVLTLAHEIAPVAGSDGATGARSLVGRTLRSLDLEAIADDRVGDLDTATRRWVDLATVAVRAPKVLLLDEPSNGLGRAGARSLASSLRRIQAELEITVVVVDHDLEFVTNVADDVIVLDRGVVSASGPAGEVLNDEGVLATLLGAVRDGDGRGSR